MAATTDTIADDELLIVRTFDAPVALVFRIWEDRDHMMRWLGPKDFTCTHLTSDFRPGGKWRACIVSDAYGENWMGGEYREIERNSKIVYTFAWDDGPDAPGLLTLVTVTFREADGRTIQSFHQTPFASVQSRDSHIGGWQQCFDRQQAYVEAIAPERAP
jgi:uncharacterized protein YndB with AHSA1/START domain